MKIMEITAMLLACAEGNTMRSKHRVNIFQSFAEDTRDAKLSQSFASAFQMAPPKLMHTKGLPDAGLGCPTPGKTLTYKATGGAFHDGCYMNTTRSQARDEATGEEAQHFLYMWKHACSFTKWVPSNQFMYSNLDYDATTMTLERFGFIGMEKKCFWGSIGVLWKRPLPISQILPSTTVEVNPPKGPAKPKVIKMAKLHNSKAAKTDCLGVVGDTIQIAKCRTNDQDVWQMLDNGEIKHYVSGQCMSAADSANMTPIKLAPCSGKPGQHWHETPASNNQFMLENNEWKNKCVDLPGGEGSIGLKTQVWDCSNALGDNMLYVWGKSLE